MNIKNIFLPAFVGFGTFALMAAESQQQPEVGKAAPDFSLTTGDGSQVSLKDYKGKWVVLYFYPKDFTSGCTLEAHNFQRDLSKYEQAGAVVLGVSVDTAQSHKDFCAKEGLAFKLWRNTIMARQPAGSIWDDVFDAYQTPLVSDRLVDQGFRMCGINLAVAH